MNHVKCLIVILASAAFVVSCGQAASTPNVKNTTANNTAATTPAKPAATVVDEAAMGNDLYAKNCMICHKDTGKGGKVSIEGKELEPIDLTSAKMKARPDDKILSGIKEGATDDGMPAFKEKLTDDQINSIIKHMRKLQSN